MFYFDHAKTSYTDPINISGFNYNIDSIEQDIEDVRARIALFIHSNSPSNIFITYNATYAANIILQGLLVKHDHVLASAMEHNAVIRPLMELKQTKGIDVSILDNCESDDKFLANIKCSIQDNTKLLVLSHISNVVGAVIDIRSIAKLCQNLGILFFVDAAQSIGIEDINVTELGIDFLIFTGHKHLLGAPGIGGGYIQDPETVQICFAGGTGRRTGGNSLSDIQPHNMPLKFEFGTLNYFGILALNYGLNKIEEQTLRLIMKDMHDKTQYLSAQISIIKNVSVYKLLSKSTSIVSFNIKSLLPYQVHHILWQKYDIYTRHGTICAPYIHQLLDTYPHGVVRVSLGVETTLKEINYLIQAIEQIAKEAENGYFPLNI